MELEIIEIPCHQTIPKPRQGRSGETLNLSFSCSLQPFQAVFAKAVPAKARPRGGKSQDFLVFSPLTWEALIPKIQPVQKHSAASMFSSTGFSIVPVQSMTFEWVLGMARECSRSGLRNFYRDVTSRGGVHDLGLRV